MKALNVGLIGCGNISKIYAAAGRTFENISLQACADLDLGRARALAAEFAIPQALSVDALLADPEIDLVINLTQPAVHAELAMKVLAAGKHVYNEKPLALRRREARKMIARARKSGLRIGCAPDTFLGGGLQTCRKLIDEGAIGEPVGGVGFMLSPGVESWHPNPEFFYKKGGGPLFDMGPYYLTALTTLLGPVQRVTGSGRASFPRRIVGSEPLAGTVIEVEVPTHVSGILDFAAGASVTLTTSFDVVAHHLPNLEIFGSEGSLKLPDPNTFGGPILLRRRGEDEWREMPLEFMYGGNSRGLGVSDMIAAIGGGRPHRANEELAYHVLDLMHGIEDASRDGQHIEIGSTMTRPEPFPSGLQPGRVEL